MPSNAQYIRTYKLTYKQTDKIQNNYLSITYIQFRSVYGTKNYLRVIKIFVENCVKYNIPFFLVLILSCCASRLLLTEISDKATSSTFYVKFIIDNVSVDVNLNTDSTADPYKDERESLLTVDFKTCRFGVSGKTPDVNEFRNLLNIGTKVRSNLIVLVVYKTWQSTYGALLIAEFLQLT